jgi:uncharacterized damage-inducible protein DinB/predicted RNase H-like HicB family nuclease
MMRYPVYLEIAGDDGCMAHVPNVPGCTVRAPTRDEALRRLPEAIHDCHAWLRRHGEPAPPDDEVVELEVVEEHAGLGPFHPGDAAALFAPDRRPLAAEEVEEHLRLMAHSRADLLALVQALPDEVLNWQPAPRSFSIRRVLRHIGSAEEWYVSRLVPPETLPPEWEDDEKLPLFEFLEMERRTAAAQLLQLSEAERSGLFHPATWTNHPDEAWSARKVLRRFLEHEREHSAQVHGILDARRQCLLVRLATERAGLVQQLLSLGEGALAEVPVLEGWTVQDLLAHIAGWDRWEEATMRSMVAGEEPDWTAVQDLDAANAAFVAGWRRRSTRLSPRQTLAGVLTEMQRARASWVGWLERLPQEEFYRPRSYAGYDWSFFSSPLEIQWRHDAEHAEQIAAWRQAQGLRGEIGPKEVLLAALAAAREELLAAAAVVPPDARTSRPVCGIWTLHDLVGHIADWEWFGVEGLGRMEAGQWPDTERIEDIDAWNRAHASVRRDQPWETVWADLEAARRSLLDVVEGMDQAGLARTFPFPWGGAGTPYQWICVYVAHDREHAQDLRGQERGAPSRT